MSKHTAIQKTNVMRLLEANHINYKEYQYPPDAAISGVDVAKYLNQNPEQVFKTLVTVSKNNTPYVFVIPVLHELDLKKAAKIVNEKALSMLKSKDLLPLTGYIHGGCSPIGMKKIFSTTFHSSVVNFQTIIFSAGQRGFQVELVLNELATVIPFQIRDITKDT